MLELLKDLHLHPCIVVHVWNYAPRPLNVLRAQKTYDPESGYQCLHIIQNVVLAALCVLLQSVPSQRSSEATCTLRLAGTSMQWKAQIQAYAMSSTFQDRYRLQQILLVADLALNSNSAENWLSKLHSHARLDELMTVLRLRHTTPQAWCRHDFSNFWMNPIHVAGKSSVRWGSKTG